MDESCTHWHFVSTDEAAGEDVYAYSEASDFNVDECPTVRAPHGHGVVCDRCLPRILTMN